GYVKEKLKASGLKYHPGSRLVRRVFLCSGAGGEGLSFAAAQGADAFVTGELKHHEALEAAVRGITAVEAGHYETERPVVPFLAAYLQKKFPNVEFICSSAEQPPMRWK
ncbi:Nif3-like dinuclear metal center hexameric protein, partial [Neglectibacter timonensis]